MGACGGRRHERPGAIVPVQRRGDPGRSVRPVRLRHVGVGGGHAGRAAVGRGLAPGPGGGAGGRVSPGRPLWATESRHSVCVLGPTQTNKTTGFAVPAILEWQGPVLATSVKDDLVANTLGWRAGRGTVWLYDPTAATGRPS